DVTMLPEGNELSAENIACFLQRSPVIDSPHPCAACQLIEHHALDLHRLTGTSFSENQAVVACVGVERVDGCWFTAPRHVQRAFGLWDSPQIAVYRQQSHGMACANGLDAESSF